MTCTKTLHADYVYSPTTRNRINEEDLPTAVANSATAITYTASLKQIVGSKGLGEEKPQSWRLLKRRDRVPFEESDARNAFFFIERYFCQT